MSLLLLFPAIVAGGGVSTVTLGTHRTATFATAGGRTAVITEPERH